MHVCGDNFAAARAADARTDATTRTPLHRRYRMMIGHCALISGLAAAAGAMPEEPIYRSARRAERERDGRTDGRTEGRRHVLISPSAAEFIYLSSQLNFRR